MRNADKLQLIFTNYNSNSNNFSDTNKSELSDWEDLKVNANENVLLEWQHIITEKRQLKNNPELENKQKLPYNNYNEDNFEIIPSENDQKNVSKKSIQQNILYPNMSVQQCNKVDKRSICLLKKVTINTFAMMTSLIEGIYLGIQIISLLFQTLFNFLIIFLQCSYTCMRNFAEASMVFIIKLSIVIIVWVDSVVRSIRTLIFPRKSKKTWKKCTPAKYLKKPMSSNSNNNAAIDECQPDNKLLCIYVLFIALTIVAWFGFCWFHSESKICCIGSLIKEIKLNSAAFLHDAYVLPGEDCMKAGRCCKGFLEATFRWLTCLVTLPIRASLTAWPRRDTEKEEVTEKVGDIKMSVDRILQELGEVKDTENRQEEILIKLKARFTTLEKLIEEKSLDIITMEPVLKSLTITLDTLRRNITTVENQLKNVISIRQESDRITENMKVTVRDGAAAVKVAISKLQTEIQTEQRKLQSRIESLELLLSEDDVKVVDFTDRWLFKVKADLDQAKLTQDDIRIRLSMLKDLPAKYKTMSDKLKKEINAKLTDELDYHDQLTKRTECFCNKGINKFKNDLETSKTDLNCFVQKLVDQQSKKIQKDIKTEISNTFYKKTVDIAKKTIEDALENNMKGETSRKVMVKGAGFLIQKEKADINKFVCNSEAVQLLNFSAYCQHNEKSNESFEENTQCLSIEEITKMVKVAVARYSADKIGLADFAVESMGGSVIASQSSPTYNGAIGLFAFIYMPLNKVTNLLRLIIQPNNKPGDCWPFAGSTGYAVIHLAHKIIVNAISLEHLPASLHPDGKILSAPKKFSIFSMPMNNQEKEELIDSFEYKEEGSAIQTYFVQNPKPAKIIKLQIHSNHGHHDFTCVYRLRVHGSLMERNDSDK